MTVFYGAGFQVGGVNTMAAKVTPVATPLTVTIAAGTYLPGDRTTADVEDNQIPPVAYAGTAYTAFAAAVKAALDAAGGGPYTVTFVETATTCFYTISRSGAFALSFSTASPASAGERLRLALGFEGDLSGNSSYQSDFVPHYTMVGAIAGRTEVTDLQEDDDVGEESVSDGGTAEVIARKTDEFLSSWVQAFEPKTAVYRRTASAYELETWTWEDFFKLTRGVHPFWCFDTSQVEDTDGTLHRLTAKGISFRPKRVTADYDGHWSIPFLTRDLGRFDP